MLSCGLLYKAKLRFSCKNTCVFGSSTAGPPILGFNSSCANVAKFGTELLKDAAELCDDVVDSESEASSESDVYGL
jgi:hypothetical protein